MLPHLPDELLKIIHRYCNNIDWKHLMDTSNDLFRDLKYRTIHVFVDFEDLNDRVLPPVVARLANPLEQLHLYLDTEDSLNMNDYGVIKIKTSWEHKGEWRRSKKNHITMTDIKWFLSIPAQSLEWNFVGPLLLKNPTLMKELRKYDLLYLDINYFSKAYLPCDDLDDSKDIKSLIIDNSYCFVLPILPALEDVTMLSDSGTIDLRNLIYSPSLKRVSLGYCKYSVIIPKELKERGVIIDNTEGAEIEEVDVQMSREKVSVGSNVKRNNKKKGTAA